MRGSTNSKDFELFKQLKISDFRVNFSVGDRVLLREIPSRTDCIFRRLEDWRAWNRRLFVSVILHQPLYLRDVIRFRSKEFEDLVSWILIIRVVRSQFDCFGVPEILLSFLKFRVVERAIEGVRNESLSEIFNPLQLEARRENEEGILRDRRTEFQVLEIQNHPLGRVHFHFSEPLHEIRPFLARFR